MKYLAGIVKGLSSILDKLAGLCFLFVMLMIVTNIILRTVFNQPILGTYELVGFLTAMGIALALGHCAFQEGHIAVSFIMERLPRKLQTMTAVLVNAISFVFWVAIAWHLGKYGYAMKIRGLISPSAEIPVYPFIYLVAFGLLGLCLVILYQFLLSLKENMAHDAAKKVPQ